MKLRILERGGSVVDDINVGFVTVAQFLFTFEPGQTCKIVMFLRNPVRNLQTSTFTVTLLELDHGCLLPQFQTIQTFAMNYFMRLVGVQPALIILLWFYAVDCG